MKTILALLFGAALLATLRAEDVPSLGRGINLGNFLEAPHEGAWTGGQLLQASDFTTIKQAGFSFVRVPISWAAHVTYQPPTSNGAFNIGETGTVAIDPQFFARVDWVVAQAEKNGLTAILDYHNDDALMKNPDANGDRFVATWKQVAEHYKDAPSTTLFELLNEPNAKLDAPHWNALLAQALAAVRVSNPTRTIIVGPVKWNSISALKDLELPANDSHLLVTFHYYEPFHFTHQGAHWVGPFMDQYIGTQWLGTDAEKKAVAKDFAKAAQWGTAHHRPMYLGEFGAFNKGDIESRARWTACIARTAEADGMAWSYWEYDQGFGAYDPTAQQWRAPLLHALIP